MGTLAVMNDNNWTHTKPLRPEAGPMRELLGMRSMGTQQSRFEMAPVQYYSIGCILLLAVALVVIKTGSLVKTVRAKRKGANASAEIRVFVRNLGTVLWPDTYRSMRSAWKHLQLLETEEAVGFARANFVAEKMCGAPAVPPDADVVLMSTIVQSVLNCRFASLPASFPFDAGLRNGVGKELVIAMVQYFGLKGDLAKLGRPKLQKDCATSAFEHTIALKIDPDQDLHARRKGNGVSSTSPPSCASTLVCGNPPAEYYDSPMSGHIAYECPTEFCPCQECHGPTQVPGMWPSHNFVHRFPYYNETHPELCLLHDGSSTSPSSHNSEYSPPGYTGSSTSPSSHNSEYSPPGYTELADMQPSHDSVHSFHCDDLALMYHHKPPPCPAGVAPSGWDMEQGLTVHNPNSDTSPHHGSSRYNSSSCIDGSTAAAAALAAMDPAAGAAVLAEMDAVAMTKILLKMDPAATVQVLTKMTPAAAAAALATCAEGFAHKSG